MGNPGLWLNGPLPTAVETAAIRRLRVAKTPGPAHDETTVKFNPRTWLLLPSLMACAHVRPGPSDALLAQAERLRGLTFTARPRVETATGLVDGTRDLSPGRQKLDLLLEAMALSDAAANARHPAKVHATYDDARNAVVSAAEPAWMRAARLTVSTSSTWPRRSMSSEMAAA